MFNKRGQFYLMAAIVIILLILGLAIVPNNLRKAGTDNSKIYELFAEVNIDSQKMINYQDLGGREELRYGESQLSNILGEMQKTYPSIKTIYILIKKDDEKMYTYPGDLMTGEPISFNNLLIDKIEYKFPSDSDDFYYLVIRENNDQQYVIKG